MSQARTLSASFSLNSYDLTVLAGSGGSVTGNGSFSHGSNPSISATPDTGYSFDGWNGEGTADSNASSTTVDMSQARTLSASFSLNSYDLTVLAGSGGSVTGSGSFSHGSNPSISATPDTGYSFDGWNGEGTADANASSTTVDMSPASDSFRLLFPELLRPNRACWIGWFGLPVAVRFPMGPTHPFPQPQTLGIRLTDGTAKAPLIPVPVPPPWICLRLVLFPLPFP